MAEEISCHEKTPWRRKRQPLLARRVMVQL